MMGWRSSYRHRSCYLILLKTFKRKRKKSILLLPAPSASCRRLNAKQRRKLKLFEVPKEEQK